MGPYVVKRVLVAIPVWLLITVCAFGLSHIARTNPAEVLLGGVQASHARILQVDKQLGLNRPLVDQYFSWLGHALHGNLGSSYFLNSTVASALWSHALVTLTITVPALLLAVVIGIGAGIISAARANSKLDSGITLATTLGMSIPEFWLAMLLILAFSVGLGVFPPLGYTLPWHGPVEWLRHVVLPAATLGLIEAAPIARMCRASLLDVLSADYIRTARSKGLSERRILFVHALRGALLPVITSMGIVVTLLLAGNFAVEVVFNIPGLGYLLVNSALQSDYPVVEGGVLLVGTVIILVNLLVDVAYAWADPKVRYE